MSEFLWMAEVEQVQEDLSAGRDTPDQFRARMRRLGFDADEIEEYFGILIADAEAA